MSRGICRDRSDIFHLRKNGASSARTITDKSVGYHVPLSNFEDDPPIRCGSLVFVPFMCFLDRSLSWTSVISHPFFFIILFVVLDTFVARTFQMAFNRRSEPSEGDDGGRGVVEKKNGRRGRRALSRDNVDKNASTGRGFIKYFTEERQVTGEITFAFEHVQAI